MNSPHQVLILFAHPALEKSRVNRRLAAAVQGLPGVTFHDLYEAYPDFHIDIQREQSLLSAHSHIVLQHPFFWYSTPPLIKQWEDLVLEHGWAYGSCGKALEGKVVLSAITTGGREVAYTEGGYNGFTMRQFLAPIEQTFRLCKMDYWPPFVVHGTHGMEVPEMERHARDYRRVILALRDGALDPEAISHLPRLNEDLDAILPREGGES